MKSFKEFMFIAEKAAIPMTPEQIAVSRARRAAAAQRLAQNVNTPPNERAAAASGTERLRTVSSQTIRGNNPSSARTAQTYSNQGVGRRDNTRSTQTLNAPRTPKPNLRSAAMGALTVAGTGYDMIFTTKQNNARLRVKD